MVKDSGKKCRHCGNNGHISRTCNEKVVKLFGVRISKERVDESMQKSLSMENLNACTDDKSARERGYASDGLVHFGKIGHRRKKGVPWTEEEHRTFLDGLEKLGKGDWRGISRKFVITRTPAQVASHAQKYFIRQSNPSTRMKRKPSLLDVALKPSPQTVPPSPVKTLNRIPRQILPSIDLARAVSVPPIIPTMPATSSIPNFQGIPYMAGNAGGRLSYRGSRFFPALSFEPMMNFPNRGYVYMPNGLVNLPTSTLAPYRSLSINPLPESAPHCASGTKNGSPSSTVETDLELRIAVP